MYPFNSLIIRGASSFFVLPLVAGLCLTGCGREESATATGPRQESALEHAAKHLDPSYVCPMHPQVASAEPGRCPLCGMDLVAKPVEADPSVEASPAVNIPDAVVNQLGVRTAAVRRGTVSRQIEGTGTFLGGASRTYRPANRSSEPEPAQGGPVSFVITRVFERDAPWVLPGQAARVRFPVLGAREWVGKVQGLENQINPLTRTLQFRVAVDLEGASVPGGMSAVVTIEAEPEPDALLVPREAVILTGKGSRVIVAEDGGRFRQREVRAEDWGGDEILVREGLGEGERVVVSSQFLLDSEANLQAGLARLSGGAPTIDPVQEVEAREEAEPPHALQEAADERKAE
jgi:hypothetical protein